MTLHTNDHSSFGKNALAERFRAELQAVGKALQKVRSSIDVDTAAHAVGISRERLNAIEAGQDNAISIILLIKLAEYYKTSPMELLDNIPDNAFIGGNLML
jgi:DNA-binding XRE family transcriptional regulator